jgi:hypothetical protein
MQRWKKNGQGVDEKGGKERDEKWVEDKRFEKWKNLILIDGQGGEKRWKVNKKGERKRDENAKRKKLEMSENGGREKMVWCGLKIGMDEIQFKSFLQLMN